MHKLDEFVSRIENFDSLGASELIDYFLFFNLNILKKEGASSKDVLECFEYLCLKKYSNISSYLSKHSRAKGPKFIKKGSLYFLERNRQKEIESALGFTKVKLNGDLFPLELIQDTRGYVINIGNQASICYEYRLFDACLVMIRKLIETLIIELFEKKEIESEIKDSNGFYFYLSDLIDSLLSRVDLSLSRNVVLGLPKIKKLGDLSAHNRRFNAKKSDIENIKTELRVVIEELVTLIDY